MEEKRNTRSLLAEGLRELMRREGMEHISVRDITEECSVGRQTFYYYFQDKYDLMIFAFQEDISEYTEFVRQGGDWAEGLTGICRKMWEDKPFYRSALRTTGPNSLPAYFRNFVTDMILDTVRRTPGSGNPESLRFSVDFCSIALVGMLEEWAEKGMREDPVLYVSQMRKILNSSVLVR